VSDIVYIKNLEIDTIIGIHDWERQSRRVVSIDLEMATDIRKAAKSEDILLAVDYSAVSVRLVDFVQNSEFLLIEAMAEKVAEIILHEFNIPWLRLRIGKPGAITNAADVGIIIERGEMP
jgi:7,8-dihydroneopterin aldolase/epimerase/oxygenase|tara:strand:- start:1653 stop:2012 length:360 start_codon:yes stop_codon:yes gene_type:complete